jgi:hypothetical protein
MPEISAAEFWAAAKAAGFFGTIIMAIMWWMARRDLEKEREGRRLDGERERDDDNKRHATTMDVLNAIKTFMEIIKDRFPRA